MTEIDGRYISLGVGIGAALGGVLFALTRDPVLLATFIGVGTALGVAWSKGKSPQ